MLLLLLGTLLFGENFSSLDHAVVGLHAVDSTTGEVVSQKNSNLSLMPSSCMKIVTTGAALHILGADTRFETHLEYEGTIDANRVLQGNIYIRGGGDPCLGSDRILPWKKQIEVWAEAIQKIGVKRIAGKIIGDASKWEKALAVPSWSWEDVGNYYGAGACALSFHENCYSLFFKPGKKVGENTTLLRTEPPLSLGSFHNEVKTGPDGSGDRACIYGSEFSPVQFVRGTIPLGVEEFSIKGAIPDPSTYCADLLAEELQKRGVVVARQEMMPTNGRVSFHTTLSPTVGEIVHWTNQKSINLYAEHLLKKMGEVVYGEGSTDAGVKAVRGFWQSQGIDLAGFHMVDGSGLSRKNLVTAAQLVEMLLKMKQSSFFSVFLDSLPEVKASVRAKQGSMSLSKGYVGYADNIVFAAIVNQCSDSKKMNENLNKFLADISKPHAEVR